MAFVYTYLGHKVHITDPWCHTRTLCGRSAGKQTQAPATCKMCQRMSEALEAANMMRMLALEGMQKPEKQLGLSDE